MRELDKAGGDDFARKVGKVVSRQVKVREFVFALSLLITYVVQHGARTQKSSKSSASARPITTTPSTPSTSKPEIKHTTQQKLKPSNSFTASGEGKGKASGKLDWSKAKPKNADKESTATKTSIKAEEVKKEPVASSGQKVRCLFSWHVFVPEGCGSVVPRGSQT